MEAGPTHFFKHHLQSFIRHVDLDALVRKLWERDILTEEEYQAAGLQTLTEIKKKQGLCDALFKKPQWVPWIVLECLKEGTGEHSSHRLLAGELRCYLQQWPEGGRAFNPNPASHVIHTLAPQFASVVLQITELLQVRNVSLGDLVSALNRICEDAGILLSVPPSVTDFASLVVFLRQQGVSHEFDIDLLCKVFDECSLPDAISLLHAYYDSIKDSNILNLTFPVGGNVPSSERCLVLTFHSLPSVSLQQAQELKDILAMHLGTPRHTFSLRKATTGSVVLVWQYSSGQSKHLKCLFEDMCNKLRSGLQGIVQRVTLKIHLEPEITVHIRKRKLSNEISSTTDDENLSCYSKRLARPIECQQDPFQDMPSTGTQDTVVFPLPATATIAPSSSSPEHIAAGSQASQQHPHFSVSQSQTSLAYAVSTTTVSSESPSDPKEEAFWKFISNLKAKYTDPGFFKGAAGPRFGNLEYINLALVKKQFASEEDKAKDGILKDSIHGLPEDIIRKKVQIDKHSDIFKYTPQGVRKLVLVEGSPGVGKTMLAMKICQDWANKEILMEYDLVFLITLRRFQKVTDCTSLKLEDLVEIYCPGGDFAKCVAERLSKCGGRNTLLILEGWDELHPLLRQEMSLFFDFITADKLPKASVMVTSRPTVTDKLSDYMDERHIEVLGFRPQQIREYVTNNFSHKASLILNHLAKFPNLKALSHIPLTLSIICKVVRDIDMLPATLTELYDRYICQVLFTAMGKCHNCSLIGLNSVSSLPESLQLEFDQLCSVALRGVEEKKYIFTSQELNVAVRSSDDCHGLLTAYQLPAKAGVEIVYQFNHTSIQEFLAAFQIQALPEVRRVELLKNYREDKQFQNVWRFFAGITRLQDQPFQKSVFDTTRQANKSQRFLVHCLYEAHDSAICRTAAIKLNYKLNLTNMSLNTTDCLCAAYVMTSAGGEWNVDLRNCNIGTEGLEIFKQHMTDPELAEEAEFSVKEFNLSHNQILLDASCLLADMLECGVVISEIHLGSNKFKDVGAEKLCEALAKNEIVTFIQ